VCQKRAGRRKRIESALNEARRLEAIGRLTGSVVHDFNNLLRVVSSACNLQADMSSRQSGCAHCMSTSLASRTTQPHCAAHCWIASNDQEQPADTFGELKADGVANVICNAGKEGILEHRFDRKGMNLLRAGCQKNHCSLPSDKLYSIPRRRA
jgi:hypothetical protein